MPELKKHLFKPFFKGYRELFNMCLFVLLAVYGGCLFPSEINIGQALEDAPSITGKPEYLNSPFVTAGNRVYMVGHQNGTFPELGWHIPGEMGGIWNHPIKLLDGFEVELAFGNNVVHLDSASHFVNYPFANAHFFEFENKNLEIIRRQFVPDNIEGLVVEFELLNHSKTDKNISLKFTAYSDLRPTWLGERTGMTDYQDTASFNPNLDYWLFKDTANPWFAIVGSNTLSANNGTTASFYNGLGTGAFSEYDMHVPAGSSTLIHIFIAGSSKSEEEALHNYNKLAENSSQLLKEKKERYQRIARQSRLTLSDKHLEQTFEWLKYNSDWLVRTVPDIGTGIGAGIPDYPWWFGVDSEYALQGYMAIGQWQTVYSTITLLDSVSKKVNGNGRIIHEMSTNGAVFNPGNINETPQFASLIWEVYKWNGDQHFLEKYFPTVEAGLNWLLRENDDNGNLFPDGFGMMEIHGLNSEMIDVASYTQRAFRDAALMAQELGKTKLAAEYRQKANELAERINQEFWSDEFHSYADFIATDEQALRLINDAIIRADTLGKPWAVEELKQTHRFILEHPSTKSRPFVVHHNWVVNTPMEVGIADPEKAVLALETAKKFTNPFGMFVTGIDRDETAGADDGSFKGTKVFSYIGAVMTLPTGVQAVAENNYGRPDHALDYLHRMARSFSYALPGSMYEVSPDYGMMTQAWNIYGFAVPIIRQFFGLDPMASQKTIYLKPNMPSSWDEASLEDVRIGDNTFSFYYSKTQNGYKMQVKQKTANWNISFINNQDTTTVTTRNATFEWN